MDDQTTVFRRRIVFSPCSEGGALSGRGPRRRPGRRRRRGASRRWCKSLVYQADHVGDADMAERLRFGDGAPACLLRTGYSSCDFASLSGRFANFAVFLRDLKPVSRRCADPSSNVSASRSNSLAVRNRASQITGLPALSANSRYQAASARNLRCFSCRS